MTITVTGLYEYPIKSCAGNSLPTAFIDQKGIHGDRRFMLTDPNGKFITQREYPRMIFIKSSFFRPTGLHVSAPEMKSLFINHPYSGEKISVNIWKDTCEAIDQGDEAAHWFSTFLGTDCRLVYIDNNQRLVNQKYAVTPDDQVTFADGYPFLIISEGSLYDLNERISKNRNKKISMDCFRANIVVSGTEGYGEDTWIRICINSVIFTIAKPCSRCAITTIDQATTERSKEPLFTLSKYRRTIEGKVMFGQNLIHDKRGIIHIGDTVEILQQAPHANFELP